MILNLLNKKSNSKIENFITENELSSDVITFIETLTIKEKLEYIKSYNSIMDFANPIKDMRVIFKDYINIKNNEKHNRLYYIRVVKYKYNLTVKSDELVSDAFDKLFSFSYFIQMFKEIYSHYGHVFVLNLDDHEIVKQYENILNNIAYMTKIQYNGKHNIDDVTLYLYKIKQDLVYEQY